MSNIHSVPSGKFLRNGSAKRCDLMVETSGGDTEATEYGEWPIRLESADGREIDFDIADSIVLTAPLLSVAKLKRQGIYADLINLTLTLGNGTVIPIIEDNDLFYVRSTGG